MADDVFPPLYQRWVNEFLSEPVEPERHATCGNCAMLDRSTLAPEELFNPRTKCCTYSPDLANYLVGRIVADKAPEMAPARRIIKLRIEAGAGVTPLGVAPTPLHAHLYDVRGGTAFGRTPLLRCPFYLDDGGKCGIHRHRDSVCSTWFCRHNRAGTGRVFWTTLNNVFKFIERTLVWWAVDQSDLDGAARMAIVGVEMHPAKLDQYQMSGIANRSVQARYWGNYYGREPEFFRACAERVEALSWPEVLTIGGAMLAYHVRLVREAQARLADPKLPAMVSRGTGLVQLGPTPGTVRLRVMGASPIEAIDVPTRAAEVVPQLLREPLAEVLPRLRAEGTDITDDMVRTLLDYQVIVPRA